MKSEILATLVYHGGSSTSSGTSALQDRATGLAPSFPECLKVFYGKLRSQNELQDGELELKEHPKWRPQAKKQSNCSFSEKVATSSPCHRITLEELRLYKSFEHSGGAGLKNFALGVGAAWKFRFP